MMPHRGGSTVASVLVGCRASRDDAASEWLYCARMLSSERFDRICRSGDVVISWWYPHRVEGLLLAEVLLIVEHVGSRRDGRRTRLGGGGGGGGSTVPAIWSDASLQLNTPHYRRGLRKPTLCNVLEARKRRRAHNLLGDESLQV
jgi:hypothetical protein